MAIATTTNYSFSKFEKFDIDWDAAVNQNWDDLDTNLTRIDKTKQVLQAQHTTTAGTDGGDLNATWTLRPLNTTVVNTITGASISANQITLPAGTYWVEASGNGFSCDNHRSRLYNVTGVADLIIGRTARAKLSYLAQTESCISGRIILAVESVLELQHICETAKTASGLGKNSNLDSKAEIFASITIRPEAI